MIVVVTSLDLVTVHVYKKTSFPLQKHLHYFVYSTSTSVHLHTTWLFFNVPSPKAQMSLSTNNTTLTHKHKHIISLMLANHCQTPPNLSHPSVTVNLNPPRGIFTYKQHNLGKAILPFDWLLMIVNYFYTNLLLLFFFALHNLLHQRWSKHRNIKTIIFFYADNKEESNESLWPREIS